MSRIPIGTTNNTSVTIPTTDYNLVGFMNGRSVDLLKITTVKSYRVKFNMRLRSYTNLYAITPVYEVTSDYYILKDKVTGENYPASMLQYVVLSQTSTLPSNTVFTNVEEHLSSITSTTVTGTLLPDDIRELYSVIQFKTGSGSFVAGSERKAISLFYSNSPLVLELNSTYDDDGDSTNGDIKLWLQYQYMTSAGVESDVNLNEQNGYYITLGDNYATNFTLRYWSSASDNMIDTTYTDISDTTNNLTILSGNYIGSQNQYVHITSWEQNSYRLDVSYETFATSDDTLVLKIVKNSNSAVHYVVKLKNHNVLNTPIYIASGKEDVWRIVSKIGIDQGTATVNQITKGTIYDETSFGLNGGPTTNILACENGVYLHKTGLDLTTITTPGKYIQFNLLQDQVSYDLVGSASATVSNFNKVDHPSTVYPFYASGTLQNFDASGTAIPARATATRYRHTGSSNTFSKSLNFKYYRGYLGTQGVNQTYDIVRNLTDALWAFSKNSEPDKQYYQRVPVYNYTAVLDEFQFSNNAQPLLNSSRFNGLNLKLDFNYSMLSDIDQRTYTIYSMGDDVEISISNPNYNNSPPVIINTSLKSYMLYEFSGTNYNNTNVGLKIKSLRLKFNSSKIFGVTTTNMQNKTWTLKLNSEELQIYRIQKDLGNPTTAGSSLNNDNLNSAPTVWGPKLYSANYEDSVTGITIPGYVIKRQANVNYNKSISYFVIARPRLRFFCLSNGTCPNIPITYNDYSALNLKQFCLAVKDPSGNVLEQSYNPFAASFNIVDINNVSTPFINTASITNDVTFININRKHMFQYDASPASTSGNPSKYELIVKGTTTTIKLCQGLGTDDSTVLATLFGPAPATDLLSLPGINGVGLLKKLSAIGADFGVNLAFLQTALSPWVNGDAQIFGIENNNNVHFTVPCFFQKNLETIRLDLPTGPGTRLNLYTREIIKDTTVTPPSYSVVLYKYNANANNIDWNNQSPIEKQVVTAYFNSRSKKIISLPARVFQQTAIESFADLLAKITRTDISGISWQNDTSYSKSVWLSVCSLNKDCVLSTMPKMFAPPNPLGYSKITIVTRGKYLEVKDKLGNTVFEINHDNIVLSPLVSTGGLLLQTMYNQVAPSTYDVADSTSGVSQMIQGSIYGFNKQLS